MATDFKYASQTDLSHYYPQYNNFSSKKQLLGWTTTGTSHLYLVRASGLVNILFADGEDLGDPEANSGEVLENGEWYYDSNLDTTYYFNNAATPADLVMEGGVDSATYFDQMLVNASMELNNMLDKRYPTPVPKYTQYDSNTTHVSSTTEYDAIIIKSTCYICVANLLRTNNRQEEADYYSNLVSNAEGTGLIDRLNKGEYKLSYEVDAKDSKGKVRTITKTGSMDIIETGGEYHGEPFDLLRVTCTTLGAYGVAKVKVEYYGSDKLFGQSEENIIVTGTLQELHSGLYVRWQGSAMAENDLWEIEVYSGSREISNASSSAVQLTRRGYSI